MLIVSLKLDCLQYLQIGYSLTILIQSLIIFLELPAVTLESEQLNPITIKQQEIIILQVNFRKPISHIIFTEIHIIVFFDNFLYLISISDL